ncbi:MAG: bile acid:sodium symporter family protein [Myxococcales bacterium]|nr:bile acid:sodium symporter family protein [Myxococcales bacterium]
MFGIALDLRLADFREALRRPKAVIVGVIGQMLLLPALSFLLIYLIKPAPSVALGMLLVAACPGGNISNFIAYLARADVAVSIALTAISTLFAAVTTPFHLAFWGGLNESTAPLLREVALDPVSLAAMIALILVGPLLVGMTVAARLPAVAGRLKRPMRWFSILAFATFIAVALANNFDYFLEYVGVIFGVVALHNSAAFLLGYVLARVTRVPEPARRTLTIEVGIQNTGLALILIFTFFDGLGGMAFIAAWWGVWHIIAGLSIAFLWSRRAAKA